MPDITKGYVVRAISTEGAFAKEEVDQDGRLQDASVNAIQDCRDVNKVLARMNKGNYRFYAYTTAEAIIKKGGRVMKVPVTGNDDHCQIFGLALKEANNLFSNHIAWP